MVYLNSAFYPTTINDLTITQEYSLSNLKNNDFIIEKEKQLLKKYGFKTLNTFSFSKEGFFFLISHLSKNNTIAVSLGESQALIEGAKYFEQNGGKIIWIPLTKEGNIDYTSLRNIKVDIIFVSSYIIDTFVKTDLISIKELTKAKLISNGTLEYSSSSDIIYFDPYKLTGFANSGLILFHNEFENQAIGFKDSLGTYLIIDALEKQSFESSLKKIFIIKLQEKFHDDLYFFVDPNTTLNFTLHFGLKGIKARDLIRTLALDLIYITNGEGCSLGLSKPSRILQAMGISEDQSRNGISLSFSNSFDDSEIERIINLIFKRYRQIKVLG